MRQPVSVREGAGLVLMILGTAMVPVAWMFSRWLWLIAGLVLFLGVVLFYTDRVMKREEELARESSGSGSSPGVPTDMHNYSGWRTGGRSETMDGEGD